MGNQNQNQPRNQKKKFEIEEDFHRITQRMRQIDIGKATDGYRNYLEKVPKEKRKPHHPRTPNPRHKMPNKWWKKAINKWRKALHAFDDKKGDAGKGSDNKEGEGKGEAKNNNEADSAKDFCCEKCSGRFAKFDEWMEHRQQCDGTVPEKKDGEEGQRKVARLSDDEDEDFDLFRLDEDTNLQITIENKIQSEDEEPEIYEGSDDDEEGVAGESVVQPTKENLSLTLSLLDQLNNVLDEDDDGDGLL